VAVLIVLVRRHRRAVGAAVRWVVDDEVPGAVEEETGPAAARRVPPGLLGALPVHALDALVIVVVVRDVGVTDADHVLRHLRERAHHEDQHLAPVLTLERGGHRPVGARRVAVELADPRRAHGVALMRPHNGLASEKKRAMPAIGEIGFAGAGARAGTAAVSPLLLL